MQLTRLCQQDFLICTMARQVVLSNQPHHYTRQKLAIRKPMTRSSLLSEDMLGITLVMRQAEGHVPVHMAYLHQGQQYSRAAVAQK